MALKVGDKAPDFTLYNTEKQQVSLQDFRGKNVLILFFPLAFTSTCTVELCDMRDSLHDYTGMNAEVLAISVDSLFTLAKWKSLEGFNFQMLSDFNKEACTAYDSKYEEFGFGMKGVAKRSAFVVDAEGTIRYAEVLEKAGELPNMEAIMAVLNELI